VNVPLIPSRRVGGHIRGRDPKKNKDRQGSVDSLLVDRKNKLIKNIHTAF